ncbi:hypothetical protein ID866_10350 [Astraeus odoratus]|nr:hypothetical protein ID866_10350 [Astraeus odoratus]
MPHHTIIILQGWAENTRATYGSGLLVYHVFCDSRDIPEMEHAPCKISYNLKLHLSPY